MTRTLMIVAMLVAGCGDDAGPVPSLDADGRSYDDVLSCVVTEDCTEAGRFPGYECEMGSCIRQWIP